MSFTVDGGNQADTVKAAFGHVHGPQLSFVANLGEGNDTAEVKLQGDVSGNADVRVELYGQGGEDDLLFDASVDLKSWIMGLDNRFDLTGDSSLNIRMDGGSHDDTVTMALDGRFGGETDFWMGGGSGGDTVEAELNLQTSSYGEMTGTVSGGLDNDYLKLAVTGSGASQAELELTLNGDEGHNRWHIATSPYVSILNCQSFYPIIPIPFDLSGI
jgi:hypothetical protein